MNFVFKNSQKIYSKKVDLQLIMSFWNFWQKNHHFMEKFIFTIDNESQYFVSENHFLYWKKWFPEFFWGQNMFPQQGENLSNFTLLVVFLRKRQKVSKFYLLVFRQKLENRSLHAENDFFQNWVRFIRYMLKMAVFP